jgi:hypothetical protein
MQLCMVCIFLGLRFLASLGVIVALLITWVVAAVWAGGTLPGISSLLLAGSVVFLETAWHAEAEARHDFVRFKKLYHERMSSQAFLAHLLPPMVFEGLKRSEGIAAVGEGAQHSHHAVGSTAAAPLRSLVAHERSHANVMFSDVVGFTTIASQLAPQDVVAVLSVMFGVFDAYCEPHFVYKVNAYLRRSLTAVWRGTAQATTPTALTLCV